ncbi:MAG: hypothetical protein ABI823_00210 [Bryobacteraceae bacterium]
MNPPSVNPPDGYQPKPPYAVFLILLLAAAPLHEASPWTVLWAAPAILIAAVLIAWAAESAQFFVAQGFALAILAWLQTLPEFAVEAVLAWKQQVPLLLANLTGALLLLTGFGWPMIYFTAAYAHRRKTGQPLGRIELPKEHSVEVIGLALPLFYMFRVYFKRTLDISDAVVLLLLYAAYLIVLSRMPPEEHDAIEDLEIVPRTIVKAKPAVRTSLIAALFVAGGALIYYSAEPFLGSLLALSTAIGIPGFVFIQYVAPFVSEFPEMASTFYWARTVVRAPMALMNMVSSNINQWTVLVAMLPIIYSVSRGEVAPIPLDEQQSLELLMTLAQALVGFLFLLNMELAWWEAATLLGVFLAQFAFSPTPYATEAHWVATCIYFGWATVEVGRILLGKRAPHALIHFAEMWRMHVRKS